MVMDDRAFRRRPPRRAVAGLAVVLVLCAGGCSSTGGSASRGLLGGLRKDHDPGVRYVPYTRGGGRDVYGHRPGMGDAVAARVKEYWAGPGVVGRLRQFVADLKQGLPRSAPRSVPMLGGTRSWRG